MLTQLDNYVRAAVPDPYTILGVKLRPFCIGHFFLMQRFNCAFSSENEETLGNVEDLLLAISICSRTYEEFIEFINDPAHFNKWCKQWGIEVTKALKKDKNFNFLHKMMLFKEYMKNGLIVPKFFEGDNQGDGKTSGAHWSQSVLLVLTGELGYTYSEAVNMPLSKALADYFKWAEKGGMVTLMNDDELEAVAEIEKGETKDGQ
jgi:hypothetical protein